MRRATTQALAAAMSMPAQSHLVTACSVLALELTAAAAATQRAVVTTSVIQAPLQVQRLASMPPPPVRCAAFLRRFCAASVARVARVLRARQTPLSEPTFAVTLAAMCEVTYDRPQQVVAQQVVAQTMLAATPPDQSPPTAMLTLTLMLMRLTWLRVLRVLQKLPPVWRPEWRWLVVAGAGRAVARCRATVRASASATRQTANAPLASQWLARYSPMRAAMPAIVP